jgi:pimeloyl-ACP methyl ester carboxylesterase
VPCASNGACEIYFETFGDPADPALLLVNGLGSQRINYADEWCQMFAHRELFVIRYDNRPDGTARQFHAIGASGHRGADLPGVTTPTLVIHGSADTLITPSGGERTAALIPGARFELIEGMGHDYPPQLWPRWVDLVASFVHEPR